MKKRCSHCKEVKDISNFCKNKSTKDGYHHQCKKCASEYALAYSKTKTGKINGKFNMLKYRYGLTRDEYHDLINKQKNKCCICGDELKTGTGKSGIDHNHETGKVRGILCRNCNILIGYLECNKHKINIAMKYIKFKKETLISDIRKMADDNFEGCNGCTEFEEKMWKSGFSLGFCYGENDIGV